MKERETSKLYHSITNVDSQFIEEILENSKKKRKAKETGSLPSSLF